MRATASRFASVVSGLGIALVLAVGCASSDPPRECRALPTECPDTVPSYTAQIAPIIRARCSNCHNPDDPSGAWPLDNLDDIVDWSDQFEHQIKTCSMPPPDSGESLPEAERALLHAWLMCGAPNN